jgi:hypothetical protein
MELDQLKEMWSDAGSKQPGPSAEELQGMLQKKSQSPIAKMKRNLTWELVTIVVFYSITIFSMRNYEKIFASFTILLLMIGLLFAIYFYFKYRLLQSMECITCEVKSNLQMQLQTLEKYVRIYFLFGNLLTPIVFFVTGFITYMQRDGDLTISPLRFWTIFSIIGLLFSVAVYFLNKWYLHKLYGQHIQKLKEILQDMEELK